MKLLAILKLSMGIGTLFCIIFFVIHLIVTYLILKVKATDVFKSKDVLLLKQDLNTMNHHIHRVLESTKSNALDYSVRIYYYFLVVLLLLFIYYLYLVNYVRN